MATKRETIKAQGLQHPNVRTVHNLEEFKEVSEQLRKEGYTALPAEVLGTGGGAPHYTFDDFFTSRMECGCGEGSSKAVHKMPLLHVSSGTAIPVKAANGHEGAYISWGFGNKVPNVVSLFISLSPYTAAALKFNIDLCTGMGPRPMYAFTQYVGGNITEKKVRLEDAGVLLQGHIRDLQNQLLKLEQENQEPQEQNIVEEFLGKKKSSVAEEMKKELQEQIDNLKKDYAEWEQTNGEVQDFLKDNNLVQIYQQLYSDMLQFNICFPELELQQKYIDPATGRQVTGAKWTPKVTGLRYRNAKTMRLEKMNDQNKIEYVYTSNQWLDDPYASAEELQIDAIPAITGHSPSADLERTLRSARTANAGPKKRPTHIVMPVSYNEYGHNYYPVPAHYSVFSGDVYLYAMTMISDRKKRRDNANVIGRIIYISDEYIQRLYQQRECTTPEKKKELFNNVIKEINTFLENKENTGKPLVAYEFLGSDGKTYKSWEIVEIEQNSKSAAEANKEELAEISSIILFAWGVDSQLIGNTPGTTTRSGGTDLRERYLLKQVQMSLMQQLVLKPLDVIKTQNGWCKPLCWEIQREVLTTLDNSKTGITSAQTE